jgi:hypothetical protein
MSLTPLAPHSQQVQSGSTSPVGVPPQDPAVSNLHYQIDGNGNIVGVFLWNIASQSWAAQPMSGMNWSEGLVAGWEGPHRAKHLAAVPTQVANACALTPRFSVAAPSTSAIQFEIHDITTGTPVVIARGQFPENAIHADAQACMLADANENPVGSFMFAPTLETPVALFTCVPWGGHAVMPADGETFQVHFAQVY